MPENTNVLLYTPRNLHAEAWRSWIEEEAFLRYSGTTVSPQQLTQLNSGKGHRAILVDVAQPSSVLASQLARAAPEAGLLFLVDSYDLEMILPLIRSGANGCISRNAGRAQLVRALIAVARDELALPEQVAGDVLLTLARDEQPKGGLIEELTDREREVLSQLAMGSTNKDIAQELMISVRTVEAHLRSVYAKLDVNTRTEAALWAVQNGYSPGQDA